MHGEKVDYPYIADNSLNLELVSMSVDNMTIVAASVERLPPVEAVVIFTRVAEMGSFTSAARSMGIPLATVSKRVAELEEHLGVRLIARTTRRSSLTEPGKRLLIQGRLIVDALQRATDEAAHAAAEPSGRLRLSRS